MSNVLDGSNPNLPTRRLVVAPVGVAGHVAAGGLAVRSASGRLAWLNVLATVVLLAAAAVVGRALWYDKTEVDLTYRGDPITNAAAMIESAEVLFLAAVDADAAPTVDGSSCFFAPSAHPDVQGPNVVCGPVWFGVSPADEPWIQVTTSYSSDSGAATGKVADLGSTTGAVDPLSFARPDGVRPAAVPDVPTWPTDPFRTRQGSRILDPTTVIALAEAALPELAELAQPVTVSPNARCFFSARTSDRGTGYVESDIWCGPVRGTSDRPEQEWLTARLNYSTGPTFGSVVLEDFAPTFASLQRLPEDGELIRPDGIEPPNEPTLRRPPLASDAVEMFSGLEPTLPAGTDTAVVLRGDEEVRFSDLGRVKEFGVGASSFSAPEGHDLVVGHIESEGFMLLDAELLIDGRPRELPRDISAGSEGTTLVVVVPSDATSVELRIDDDSGPKVVSLLVGDRPDGFADPAGLG